MSDLALMIQQHDELLRNALTVGRAGLFRNDEGKLYVRENIPLGQSYTEEVLGIFADPADLDLFYKLYLKKDK